MVLLGVAIAAILMFVGTGGSIGPQIVDHWFGKGNKPDILLINAVLLNIALIIFGWRRYSELNEEVQERRKAEERARLLAETDPLTGCLNRRSIGPAMIELTAEARRTGQSLAVLMLDLDSFKLVNDLNGHNIGDAVLTATAQRAAGLMPKNGLLARLGGDEFACIIPFDTLSPDRVDQLAMRLIKSISDPIPVGHKVFDVTVSIGIATKQPEATECDDKNKGEALIHNADIAMYHAKKKGRNRHAWFEDSMESDLRFRSSLEQGIRHGIANGEFLPFYQQQIDLESGKLVGFEMLARWNSPTMGMVNPDIFIPIVEEMGLIAKLSENLISQALEDAKTWDSDLILSVNISPLQLQDPWFAHKLLKILTDRGFPPHRLEVEITESCLHGNVGTVRSVVTSLKNQGVQISLDDFGTGYSSIAQLRALPFDRLKIDRSFVGELANEGADSKLIEAIIDLAQRLELPVTAEGIENEQILAILRQMGDMKGQGFLYGHPENAETTFARLTTQKRAAPQQTPTPADADIDTDAVNMKTTDPASKATG